MSNQPHPNFDRPLRDSAVKIESVHSRNGFHTFQLGSYLDFITLIETEAVFRSDAFIYRGHRNATWKLESSLARELRRLDAKAGWTARKEHLSRFCLAARGKTGLSKQTYEMLTKLAARVTDPGSSTNLKELVNTYTIREEVEIWALAQHYHLATPLLDWSASPLTALYFAFEETKGVDVDYAAVYLLHRRLVEEKTTELREIINAPFVDIFESFSDENPRLIAQFGLFSIFTRVEQSIEEWVTSNFRNAKDRHTPVLIKFIIPTANGADCRSLLRAFGVNSATVYPDLLGVTKYCNQELRSRLI